MNTKVTILNKILDILFPYKETEKKIQSLDSSILSEKIQLNQHNGTTFLFSYKDPLIRKMIWMLKYKGNRHVAKLFAEILHSYLLEELSEQIIFESQDNFYIVPIPLSKQRKRKRGFNQMTYVVEELEKLGGITTAPELLIRIKNTPPQTSLKDKTAREKNIIGAFNVNIKKFPKETGKNKTVILIDDVLTTGSTLKEAKKTLREHGIKNVHCIALAH